MEFQWRYGIIREAQLETPITPLCPEYVRYRPSIAASYHKAEWLSRRGVEAESELRFEDLQMRDVMLDWPVRREGASGDM
jgi:hypothetical protein